MSKIRGVLLLLVVQSAYCATGQVAGHTRTNAVQTDQRAVFTAHHSAKPRRQASVRTVNPGPEGEPALPDNAPNPKPVTVADRPDPVSLRRRKLRLKQRT